MTADRTTGGAGRTGSEAGLNPNPETVAAMEEARKRDDLPQFESVKELLEELKSGDDADKRVQRDRRRRNP